jgi:Xaa-Pro aminopeptidase
MIPPGGVGVARRPDGGPPDFERLRVARRRRLLEAMEEEDLDVLALGRPASIAYASGSRQLWTAGTHPYGPGCLVVRSTGRVHLISTWDEGVPEEISRDELIGRSWNPTIAMDRLRSIPGLSRARRIGTDGWRPGTAALFPAADVVDANSLLQGIRVPRTEDEIACIRIAASIAESALTAMISALRQGVTERELVGVYLERIALLGSPPPPSEGVACLTPVAGSVALRRVAGAHPAERGQLAALSPGAFFAGYEAGLARTWPVGHKCPAIVARGRAAVDAITAACVPGATGADICRAWDRTGEAWPAEPLVRGLGLGTEQPVIGKGLGQAACLQENTVLAVQAWVAEDGIGGVLDCDTILVGPDGPIPVTRYGRPVSSRNRA